ncbi:hypothetical protein JIN84_08090 [Luteolibacter yonseiensis]|uniref:Uncharacterized protein n=1 Tax=Luteolibacter yonseiensis TaxID=1144680 RepID=A0A934VB53_9BACT|nr:hypothetical protein [Luteolibacter yonseiensis]MBK1815571.1 hypothetical protein [Luteolibacter yonseiensis]
MFFKQIISIVSSLVVTSSIAEATPVHDDFANSIGITAPLPVSIDGDNKGATLEAGEPDPGAGGGASVWYRWTAPSNGDFEIKLLDKGPDANLRIFTGGSVDSLQQLSRTRTRSVIAAVSGTTYQFSVHAAFGQEGSFGLAIRPITPPVNDHFANGFVIPPGLPVTLSGSHVDATWETGEAYPVSQKEASVWYRWTAPASGSYEISLPQWDLKSTFHVFTGDALDALKPIASSDFRESIAATAGTTYHISVVGKSGVQGAFKLGIRANGPPANDNFANRIVIPAGLPVSLSGSNLSATLETGEPYFMDNRASVWYQWTAPSTGNFRINTIFPHNSEPVIRIFTGNSLESLHHVASAYNGRSSIAATAGTTYQIAVQGFHGYPTSSGYVELGTFQLEIREPSPPLNDRFSQGIMIPPGLPASVRGSNVDATLEPGELSPDQDGGASVWYRWVAPASGKFVISLPYKSFSSVLHVFTGNAFNHLTPVVTTSSNAITITATAGTIYQIAVHGYGPELTGEFELAVRAVLAPGNDHFANRFMIPSGLPVSVEGSQVDGTREEGEPDPSGGGGVSVWYRWTAPSSGNFQISFVNHDVYASQLNVYTGNSINSLNPVASVFTRTVIKATAGTEYQFRIEGARLGEAGFELAIRQLLPPANDDFAARIVIPEGLPAYVMGSSEGAGIQPGELNPENAVDVASVWYSWTAPATGNYEFSVPRLNGVGHPLDIYSGSTLETLTPVTRITYWGTIAATAGTTYQIAASGSYGGQSPFQFVIRRKTSPVNDHFANSIVIPSSVPVDQPGSNVNSSDESGEPKHGDYEGSTVWYRWTAPAAGVYKIGVADGDLDLALDVYTGSLLRSLTPVVSNASQKPFIATAGTTYQIALYGVGGDQGAFQLEIRQAAPPKNDLFANGTVIPAALPAFEIGTNVVAALETGEPASSGGKASVWYQWKPTSSGSFEIRVPVSGFYPILRVFTGNAVNTLASVASGNRTVTINAIAGTNYRIAVLGDEGGQGEFQLQIRAALLPPANDQFANRIAIPTGVPVFFSGTNVAATMEAGEPDPGTGNVSSVWYRWTAPKSGSYEIQSIRGDFDTYLRIFTGTSVGGLSPVASGSLRKSFNAIAGTTYQISVHGSYGGKGLFNLEIHENVARPGNDDFSARTALSESNVTTNGSNQNATLESGEPNLHQNGGASIWYSWRPPVSGYFRISTHGSGFDTILQVFTGSYVAQLQAVASNDNASDVINTSELEFYARANVRYNIAVLGYRGARGNSVLNIEPSALGALQQWSMSYGLDGPYLIPSASPRQDGISNLLKFAFNMDPTVASSGASSQLQPGEGTSGLPAIRRVSGGLRIDYLRRKDSPGLKYRPQFSSTLGEDDGEGGWSDAREQDQQVQNVNSYLERVIVQDPDSGANAGADAGETRFGRVVVELEPAR